MTRSKPPKKTVQDEVLPMNGHSLRISVRGPSEFLELSAYELFEAGALGLEEFPDGLRVYARNQGQLVEFQELLEDVRSRLTLSESSLEVSILAERIENSWQDKWLLALGPEAITARFTLRPTHCHPAPAGETTLWFQAMSSFGSGQHPTTKLAARFVEAFLEKRPQARCLDVGTGTGVLSLVAARSGSGSLVAVDNDPLAIQSIKKNLLLNDLEKRIAVKEGSADTLQSSFDLVMANINTVVLYKIAASLYARLAEEGTLMLTGLLQEEETDVSEHFSALGLERVSRDSLEGWSLLEWRRSPPSCASTDM